jgi:phosphopantetheinyl transferase
MTIRFAECRAATGLMQLREQLAPGEFEDLLRLSDRSRARARAHAYTLIRGMLNLTPFDCAISYLPDGRPHLCGVPFDVSISHAEDLVAVAAVEGTYRIGIDIETFARQIDAGAFVRFLVTEGELDELDRMRNSGWGLQEAVISIWSAKESFCKCAGYSLRPADLSLRWSMDFAEAAVAPAGRLRTYLEARELVSSRISIDRNQSRVRAITVMRQGPRNHREVSLASEVSATKTFAPEWSSVP